VKKIFLIKIKLTQ